MATERTPQELPADNAARIAIYDALSAAAPAEGNEEPELTADDLFTRVIGRLRVLVPRELHLSGERAYVDEKVEACIGDGIVRRVDGRPELLTLGEVRPQIRWLDGSVRDYNPSLEKARERLESDESKLRMAGFDVLRYVPSLADRQNSRAFRELVESMREHGYVGYPVLMGAGDGPVDGRARKAASKIAGVKPLSERLPQRRDTPLHRVLLVLDLNRARLNEEDIERVYSTVEKHTGRSWQEIAEDLSLTRAWRSTVPKPYTRDVDVKKVPYRDGDPPKVQVTPDGKVMMRSLLRAAGLAEYKFDKQLSSYVHSEKASTKYTAHRMADFVGIDDAIAGIATMQRDRKNKGRVVDAGWEEIRKWLVGYRVGGRNGRTEERADAAEAVDASAPQASESG